MEIERGRDDVEKVTRGMVGLIERQGGRDREKRPGKVEMEKLSEKVRD